MNIQQLVNTCKLLSIVEAKIDKDEPEEVLDSWIQPCGTVGCVLGDYMMAKHPKAVAKELRNLCEHVDFMHEFGFDPTDYNTEATFLEYVKISGDSTQGTLKQRRSYIKSVLEEELSPTNK